MCTSQGTPEPDEDNSSIDATQDRYVTFETALSRLMELDDFPQGVVEHVELHCLQSGEVTWRVWEPKADEPQGGILPAED